MNSVFRFVSIVFVFIANKLHFPAHKTVLQQQTIQEMANCPNFEA
jgi:hypothetical protein